MPDRTYRLVVRAATTLFAALGLRIDVQGSEHLPRHGPAVLASNHVGFLDFLFVGLVGTEQGRLVRFLAKEGSFRPPVVGGAMRAMGHVAVDRGHGEVALRHAVGLARRGEVVGLFPEATISHAWTLRPFRPGAAATAAWSGAPLVPVVVWGSQRVLSVRGRWARRRGIAVSVLVGEPLHPGPSDDPVEVTVELRARMEDLLAVAMDRYPDEPRGDRDRWWLPAARGGTAPTPEEGARLDEEGMRRVDDASAARAAHRRARAVRRQARR